MPPSRPPRPSAMWVPGLWNFSRKAAPSAMRHRSYFLEMNTRLQVEHPVTEAVTGTDLVEWQFRVAAGEELPKGQDGLTLDGHAVEARVYAEDPERGFIPSSGRLVKLAWADGDAIRIDTGVREGDEVTPFYDPMVAKIIAHGASREDAIAKLRTALSHTVIAGPRTNMHFVHALLDRADVAAGVPDTGLVERIPAGVVAGWPGPGRRRSCSRSVGRKPAHRFGCQAREGIQRSGLSMEPCRRVLSRSAQAGSGQNHLQRRTLPRLP